MTCGRDAELLRAYLDADQAYNDATVKAHTVVPGEPMQREWLDADRIELIDRLDKERDGAQRTWHQHLVSRQG